jgi:hypothetical protein
MSKQTSTARSLHDLFSDDHANPSSGDEASQGEMKSDSASASVAPPSRLAPVAMPFGPTPPALPSTSTSTSTSPITMCFDKNGNCYTPPQTVDSGGTVILKYDVTGCSLKVSTTPTHAFNESPDYCATHSGSSYTLPPRFSGTVTLTPAKGTTGTINVGGGSACPPGDDGDHCYRQKNPRA